MKFFPLIWAALWRKKLRTILTLLSIVIAFLLFGMLQGVNAAFQRGVENANVNRLIVSSRISLTEALPISQMQQIESVPGVAAVAHATWFMPTNDPKNFIFAVPVEIDRYLKVVPEIKTPPEQLEALKHTRDGMIVWSIAAKKQPRRRARDRILLHSTIWTRKADGQSDWDFEVVGFYDFTGDSADRMPRCSTTTTSTKRGAFRRGTVGW